MRLGRVHLSLVSVALLLGVETVMFFLGGKWAIIHSIARIGTLLIFGIHCVVIVCETDTSGPVLSKPTSPDDQSLPMSTEQVSRPFVTIKQQHRIYPVESRHYSKNKLNGSKRRSKLIQSHRRLTGRRITRPSAKFGTFGVMSEIEP